MIARRFLRFVVGLAPLLMLLAAGSVRADPPARVGHLTAIEGSVSLAPAGENEWNDAAANWPLTRGDRLWTDRGTRAELQIGSSAVRLGGQTRLEVSALDDQSAQLSVTQGSVFVHVRSLPEGENFEVDTPNLAYRAAYPGDYRIDVDAAQGTTRVTIHSGMGGVYGENGQTQTLGGGQQVVFRGRALQQVATQEAPPQDAFDRWAFERNRREDQSIAARYVPREVVGYQQLDPYGQWRRNEQYGAIWFPQGLPAGWAPYRQGHWDWIAPWGWTWIDDAPWGFAPFHYGRWALVDDQWAWVPGRLTVRPVYAPALVAFVGGSTNEASWFPLAPGEAWLPPYSASALYISNVNHNLPVAPPASYAHQRRTQALTSIALADFQRGRPGVSGWWRVATNLVTSPPIVPPPAMPARAVAVAHQSTPARAAPPATAPAAPVIAQAPATPATGKAPVAAPLAAPTASAPAMPSKVAAAPVAPAAPVAAVAPAVPAAPVAPAAATAANAPSAPAAATPPRMPQEMTVRKAVPTPAPVAVARPAKPAVPATSRQAAHVAQRAAAPQEPVARRGAGDIDPAPAARTAQTPSPVARGHAATARAAAVARERAAAAGMRAERLRRQQAVARAEQVRREQAARQHSELARREAIAQARRREQVEHAAQVKREEHARRQEQAKRDEQARREAKARADERLRRELHMAQVQQARRVAERDAQALREQRTQREQQLRRAALERDREQAQREAAEREQQALTEQWRRDRQAWEQRQDQGQRQQRPRPDLRPDGASRPPEVWQRGIPILRMGPTS